MHVHSAKWIVGALAVLVLMVIGIDVGMTLLPPMAVAQTKGTIVPWFFTWGLIVATVVMGVVLAVYMIGVALGKVSVNT
jgi:hypothetical protein